MQRRATLRDVARVAGVHLSTVSRALNPRTQSLLTPEVVARIGEISRELDYSPNAAAHSLRTNRTRTIGIVVPDITNPVFPPIIRGIEDAVAQRGYLAIVANTDSRLNKEAEIAHLLRARGVDGLVLASVERVDDAISRLSAEGLPMRTSPAHRLCRRAWRATEPSRRTAARLPSTRIRLSSPSPRPSMRTKALPGRRSSFTAEPFSPRSSAPTTVLRSVRSRRFAGM